MPRKCVNRSISFEPWLLEAIDNRRLELRMQRSDYIRRCILKDLEQGGSSFVIQPAAPGALLGSNWVTRGEPVLAAE